MAATLCGLGKPTQVPVPAELRASWVVAVFIALVLLTVSYVINRIACGEGRRVLRARRVPDVRVGPAQRPADTRDQLLRRGRELPLDATYRAARTGAASVVGWLVFCGDFTADDEALAADDGVRPGNQPVGSG